MTSIDIQCVSVYPRADFVNTKRLPEGNFALSKRMISFRTSRLTLSKLAALVQCLKHYGSRLFSFRSCAQRPDKSLDLRFLSYSCAFVSIRGYSPFCVPRGLFSVLIRRIDRVYWPPP